MVEGRPHRSDVDLDTVQLGGIERAGQGVEGRIAIGACHNHLGQQRIIGRRDLGTHLEPAVDANVGSGGKRDGGQRAGARTVVARRVLGVYARLHGVAAYRDGTRRRTGDQVLVQHVALTTGEPEHPTGQVDAGDRLGDRMLDL